MTRKMPWLRDSEYARHHLYNKCSRATKVETWTTQREDIQIDEFSRAITGERERESRITQRNSVLCHLIAFLKSF